MDKHLSAGLYVITLFVDKNQEGIKWSWNMKFLINEVVNTTEA